MLEKVAQIVPKVTTPLFIKSDFSQKLVFAHFQIKQKQISVCQIKVCLRLYIEKCGLSFTNLLLDAHRDEGGLAIFRKQIEEKRLNTSIFLKR